MSEYLRPMENTVMLEPTEVLCRAEDRIRLLIAVHSAPGNAEERRVIRESRDSRSRKIHKKIVLLSSDKQNISCLP